MTFAVRQHTATTGGGTGRDAYLTDQYIFAQDFEAPWDMKSYYSLQSDGQAGWYVRENGDTTAFAPYSGEWRVGSDPASGYEVEVVVSETPLAGGSAPHGAGTWSSLGTTRTWFLSSTVGGSKVSYLAVTIRDVDTHVTLASATITLETGGA